MSEEMNNFHQSIIMLKRQPCLANEALVLGFWKQMTEEEQDFVWVVMSAEVCDIIS